MNFASHDHFKKALYRLIEFGVNVEKGLKGSPNEIKCVIIDLSCMTYVDASGVKALQTVIDELQATNIEVFLATTECEYFLERVLQEISINVLLIYYQVQSLSNSRNSK